MNPNPRIERLLKQKEQILARIKQIEAREKSRQKKEDTRRKILLGAMVMEWMDKDEPFRKRVRLALDKFLTREMDRNLFGLTDSGSVARTSEAKTKGQTP